MAREIPVIKKVMTDWFIAQPIVISLYGLDSTRTFEQQFSVASIESMLFYCVAACFWTVEVLFDRHVSEVTNIIDNLKPHTLRWYANMVKLFQYGDNLDPETGEYDNTGKTNEEIQASRIVTYSAVVDQLKNGLLIKVAKDIDGELGPLTPGELIPLSDYIFRKKDAGVLIELRSTVADKLELTLTIHYNPLVYNSLGQRLDGTSLTPVPDAVRLFLKNLPFNGLFVLAYLTDALQLVDGIVIPTITLAQYSYGNTGWRPISVMYQPDSGYLRIADADLMITYIPQSQIL